jgi:hypothetical protein
MAKQFCSVPPETQTHLPQRCVADLTMPNYVSALAWQAANAWYHAGVGAIVQHSLLINIAKS